MPDIREQRQRQAKRHIGLMKNVYAAEIEACAASAKIYEDGEGRELPVPEPQFEATATAVTTDFAAKALYGTSGKAVIIDAGAFTRPGGNYEAGSFGPEQALCSDSALYPVLCALKKSYYDKNRGWECSQLFSDRALYLTDVMFSRNGTPRTADVVVIAAPNRKRALEGGRSPEFCDQVLGFRIEAMLRVAAQGGASTLICGAFGCGPQGNPAAQVIGLIQAWLAAHPGVFENVIFAVPRASEAAFAQAFGRMQREQKPAAMREEPQPKDDDDDEDWRTIELPEGVTLR